MDIAQYRPECPPVFCPKCSALVHNMANGQVQSTAMHFDLPPTRYGILFLRVNCHGEQQDIACTFEWLESNRGRSIIAFTESTEDYGLRDLVELDGFGLPKELEAHRYQLAGGRVGDHSPSRESQPNTQNKAEARSPDLLRKPQIDERFIRAIERELASRTDASWAWANITPNKAGSVVRIVAAQLDQLLYRSNQEAVNTAEITAITARMAVIALKIFERFGTPRTAPKQNIVDALPNPAAGTIWDKPMSGKAIDLKPAQPQIE